jgi:hypothetical protein
MKGQSMIRRPTPSEEQYRWWRLALVNGVRAHPPINDEPQCGYYRRRLCKGGAYVPARIWLEQEIGDDGELLGPEILRCEVNGQFADPQQQWSYLAKHPIPIEEYDFMRAYVQWARAYSPSDPVANPYKAIDNLQTPITFTQEMDPDT